MHRLIEEFGVTYKPEFDELFTPSGAMRQLPPEGAHTVSLIFAVSRLYFCLPLEGAGCLWQPLSVCSEAPTEAAAVTEGVKFRFIKIIIRTALAAVRKNG